MAKTRKRTVNAKYGVDFTFQSSSVKKKIARTMLSKFGVANPSQSPLLQQKKVVTNLKKFGVPNSMQCPEVKAKAEMTMLQKHGAKNPSQVKKFQRKKVKTCLAQYGTRHHLQNPQVLAKALLSAHLTYRVTVRTKQYLVQGYERYLLLPLLAKYRKVKTQFDSTFPALVLLNRRFTYVPDFYLPTVNTYVEVKSTWTLLREAAHATSARKAAMAAAAGYTVRLVLVLDARRAVILPRTWYSLSLSELEALIPTLSVTRIDNTNLCVEKANDPNQEA